MTDERSYKILYIEDNQANRQLVQLILERKKHLTLSMANYGKSGIASAKQQLPDLVLLDISLPDMTGYAVLAALRTDPATEKIPVVAISGEYPPHIPENSPYLFERYLPKPIDLDSLYRTLDELLHQ